MSKSLLEFIGNDLAQRRRVHNGSFEKMVTVLRESGPFGPEVPIIPKKSTWEILSQPERLGKTFEFEAVRMMKYFLEELIDHQEDINHHAKITINHRSIIIETYTIGVNGVTELDKELAVFCDELFSDVMFYEGREDDSFNE
jgi:pterin-4a-carbinolamine dehydratase